MDEISDDVDGWDLNEINKVKKKNTQLQPPSMMISSELKPSQGNGIKMKKVSSDSRQQ